MSVAVAEGVGVGGMGVGVSVMVGVGVGVHVGGGGAGVWVAVGVGVGVARAVGDRVGVTITGEGGADITGCHSPCPILIPNTIRATTKITLRAKRPIWTIFSIRRL
jgi:hypothetical protein